MKHIFLHIVFATATTISLLAASCTSPTDGVAKSSRSGGDTLDVAIEIAPTCYYTYGDTTGGFQYDLMCAYSAASGTPVKFHPVKRLSEALEALADSSVDVVVAQFPMIRENRSHYRFTRPLYLDELVLVQRNDSSSRSEGKLLTTQLDLAGQTVHVAESSPAATRLHGLAREIGDSIKVKELSASGTELCSSVADGKIDYAVVSQVTARHMAGIHHNLNVAMPVSFTQFYSFVLRRPDEALCARLNKWLDEYKQSPDYFALIDRYFPYKK